MGPLSDQEICLGLGTPCGLGALSGGRQFATAASMSAVKSGIGSSEETGSDQIIRGDAEKGER